MKSSVWWMKLSGGSRKKEWDNVGEESKKDGNNNGRIIKDLKLRLEEG